jgi:hypothetical protein
MSQEPPTKKAKKEETDRRFLNVLYGSLGAQIDVKGALRLSQVQAAIKDTFDPDMASIGAPDIQLYDQSNGILITDLDDIPDEFFQLDGQSLRIQVE